MYRVKPVQQNLERNKRAGPHDTLQVQYQPDPGYISSQPAINARMRRILADWLVLVHIKFQLQQETLYLTVSIIDRFLQVLTTHPLYAVPPPSCELAPSHPMMSRSPNISPHDFIWGLNLVHGFCFFRILLL